jgi:NhaA family Na+:H+ antiporter
MLGICQLPSDLGRKHVIGAGLLAGIGFTMSIFISLLAFDSVADIGGSKLAVLAGSMVSGLAGWIWLRVVLGKSVIEHPLEN